MKLTVMILTTVIGFPVAASAQTTSYEVVNTNKLKCSLSGAGIQSNVESNQFVRGRRECGVTTPVDCPFSYYIFDLNRTPSNDVSPRLEPQIDDSGVSRSIKLHPSAVATNFLKRNPYIERGFKDISQKFELREANFSKEIPVFVVNANDQLTIVPANLSCQIENL